MYSSVRPAARRIMSVVSAYHKPKQRASLPQATLSTFREIVPKDCEDTDILDASENCLQEICMDVGKHGEGFLVDGSRIQITTRPLMPEDLGRIFEQVSKYYDPKTHRAGIPGTLHRISFMFNTHKEIVGLTCRLSQDTHEETSSAAAHILETYSTSSCLLLGPPCSGKTTLLRAMAEHISTILNQRVLIVDKSGELGGATGSGVSSCRRLFVTSTQYRAMLEAVENHSPDCIVVDEISTAVEALACRSISQRGVRLIATAHGSQLMNLVNNPELNDIVGGTTPVTLTDNEAKLRGSRKTILERVRPPSFHTVVEMDKASKLPKRIWETEKAVDAYLRMLSTHAS
jgi:stage III sporulation protein SpoIIIAA